MDVNTVIGYCKSGYQKSKFKKLKKGDLRIEARFDLHHVKNRNEALAELEHKLPLFQLNDQLVILVIHGKGNGVVKEVCDKHFQYNPMVLAYHSAQPKDGGAGAVYVHLKNINKTNNFDEYYEEE